MENIVFILTGIVFVNIVTTVFDIVLFFWYTPITKDSKELLKDFMVSFYSEFEHFIVLLGFSIAFFNLFIGMALICFANKISKVSINLTRILCRFHKKKSKKGFRHLRVYQGHDKNMYAIYLQKYGMSLASFPFLIWMVGANISNYRILALTVLSIGGILLWAISTQFIFANVLRLKKK